jgi:hypothetical protein
LRLLTSQNFRSKKIDPFKTALETQMVNSRLLNIINGQGLLNSLAAISSTECADGQIA